MQLKEDESNARSRKSRVSIMETPENIKRPSTMSRDAFDSAPKLRLPSLSSRQQKAEVMTDAERLRKRFEYGKKIRSFADDCWSASVVIRSASPHVEVGSHRVQKSIPIIDFSYMGMKEPADVFAAEPRSGNLTKTNKSPVRSPFQSVRPNVDQQAGDVSDRELLSFRPRGPSVIIIRQGETTYAFNTRSGNKSHSERRKSVFRGTLGLQVEVKKEYSGSHLNLSHNSFVAFTKTLAQALALLVETRLSVLDLSCNGIVTIEANLVASDLHSDDYDDDELPRRAPAVVLGSLNTLYLHGNQLRSFGEVLKLQFLAPSLRFLTFHDNQRVEEEMLNPKLRAKRKILEAFPNLVSLNFTTLTHDDRDL